MKPLLVNTLDNGGAAKACIRLHLGLLDFRIPSKLLVSRKTQHDIPELYNFSATSIHRSIFKSLGRSFLKISESLRLYKPDHRKIRISRPDGLEMISMPYSFFDILKSSLLADADIINLHWVANFLDYPSFFKRIEKPVVWTLHDQNPFLGVEHYEECFYGIDSKGHPKKRTFSEAEKKLYKRYVDIKINALKSFNELTIVAPSAWLAKKARESEVFGRFNVYNIPYGLDSNIFKPRDKEFSRALLNIPFDKKVLLFVAGSVLNNRKGFVYLERALESISNSDLFLVSVGSNVKAMGDSSNIVHLGIINDELLMSIVYSAADVFVIPSLMDNLPNTVLESIMCGTPVIGFPVGGIPDMIKDGVNGYLTDEISVGALKSAIEKFLEDPEVFDRDIIRRDAVRRYDLSVQAKAYIDLFSSILDKR